MKTGLSIILLSLFLFLMPLQVFAAEEMSVSELLDRYAANQDKLTSSVIVKFECEQKFVQDNEVFVDRTAPVEVRLDGQKYLQCTNYFYNKLSDTTLSLDETDYRQVTLWDGERRFKYYDRPEWPRAWISRQNKPGVAFTSAWPGSPLFGVRFHKAERIDTVLRQCEKLSVREETEIIGSEACYVIDAKSPTSTYVVWMNPNRGHSISQAVIKLGPGAQGAFEVLSENENRFLTVSDIQFQQIGEVHVPMVYKVQSERRRDGVIYRKGTVRGKVTDITFDPDHEKLGSFVPKMREGTIISDKETGSSFIWQEGMKFVVDQWDGRIKYVPKDWSALVGADKPLPRFEGIEISLPVERAKDKAILLCFFDMQQRPSLICLQLLSSRSKELKAKDIVVIAVQASKVEQIKLDEWINENDISFPVGMVAGDEEKVRFGWGVRSLPWLILTDKEHIVTAEGFGISKLDQKTHMVSETKDKVL
jgi:hypothetical protein